MEREIHALGRAEEEYARMSKSASSVLIEQDRERIQALASDLPRVWNDPHTSARDRKWMLRLLIEDVNLVKRHKIQIHTRWKGASPKSACASPGACVGGTNIFWPPIFEDRT